MYTANYSQGLVSEGSPSTRCLGKNTKDKKVRTKHNYTLWTKGYTIIKTEYIQVNLNHTLSIMGHAVNLPKYIIYTSTPGYIYHCNVL